MFQLSRLRHIHIYSIAKKSANLHLTPDKQNDAVHTTFPNNFSLQVTSPKPILPKKNTEEWIGLELKTHSKHFEGWKDRNKAQDQGHPMWEPKPSAGSNPQLWHVVPALVAV